MRLARPLSWGSIAMSLLAVAVVLPPVASEWECPAGSIAGSHGVAACCPAACGHCGGRGCEVREGGRQACCALDIQMAGRSCNDTAPPCVPLGRVEPGERTQHAVRFVAWNQCGSQAANLGTEHATAYECAAAARDNAACGSTIMFSPTMNAHWGCRCCRGNDEGGVAHKRWQLHRVGNAHKLWQLDRTVNASSNGHQLRKSPSASMPRCHICVTGQLQRLELSKKWDMMIHPISAFMNVTVILCLNRQTSHFARPTVRDGKMVDTDGFHGNSSYLDMPLRSFQGVTKRDGVTLHTRWVSYDELENISIVTSRIHDHKSTRTPQVTLKRAASHLRQYYTQTWCDIGVLPDYFIKIRDDAIPLFRINWYTVLRYTRRSSKMVVTQHCASWHGLNDKIAIVGGSNHSISKYIYAPFSRYHQATPRWVMNPETYLLYVMMQEGFVQYSANLGVVTSRKMENGSRVYPRGVDKCEERWIQRAGAGSGGVE